MKTEKKTTVCPQVGDPVTHKSGLYCGIVLRLTKGSISASEYDILLTTGGIVEGCNLDNWLPSGFGWMP